MLAGFALVNRGMAGLDNGSYLVDSLVQIIHWELSRQEDQPANN